MDNLDHRIIDLLRQNGRAGYGDIGGTVGLSASAVKRRVDRLVADGVIRGFTIQVDPAVDGLSTEAYVELFCRGTVAPDELSRASPRSSTRAPSRATPTPSSASAPATSRASRTPSRRCASRRTSTTRAARSCCRGW
jgi:hypothetical protein